MSKSDGDNFDPLDFDLPDDDLIESGDELDAVDGLDLESIDEAPLSEEPVADDALDDLEESSAPDDELEEAPAKPGKKKKKEKKKKEKKPRAKKEKKPKVKKERPVSEESPDLVAYLVLAFCGLSCLAVLVADVMIFSSRGSSSIVFILIFTIIWLIGTAIPFLLWKGRQTNTVYVVFLGISLAGILVANLLLLLELSTYGGDFGAKGAQQSMHRAPAVQSAPDNTTATV